MNLKTEAGKNSFYQWDTNQQLIVEDAPDCQEVHFSHRGDPAALVCSIYEADGERVVDVPNILLQQDKPITAYLFSRADDSNRTCHAWSFLVIGRPQPEDYVYTETEVLTYKALEERIIALEEGGGTVTDEQIATAVESYLAENPVKGGLDAAQVTALDNMFKVCAYDESKDYASAYMAFKQAFGLAGSSGGEEPEPETPATYSILNTLTNVTSSNAAVSATGGNPYFATLTPADGHTIDSVVVTMGGVDISATAVNGVEISISSVTGDIVIIATAAENQAQPVEMSPWYVYGGATMYSDNGQTDIGKDCGTKACSVNPFGVDTIISFTYVNGDAVLYQPPVFACLETPVTGNSQNPVGYYAEAPTHTECGASHSSQLPAGETHTYTYTVKAGYYLFIGYLAVVNNVLNNGTFTITGKAV